MRMRRFALLGLVLGLPGCSGVLHFFSDTTGLQANHNAPLGDSETMRRARGEDSAVPPLLTEPGDVWPGPPKAEPTLSDLEREENTAAAGQAQAGANTPFIAVPPATGLPAAPAPRPIAPSGRQGQTFQTPTGPAKGAPAPSGGYQLLTNPKGESAGIAIPNGNGTTTIIAPDGGVSTVPTPK